MHDTGMPAHCSYCHCRLIKLADCKPAYMLCTKSAVVLSCGRLLSCGCSSYGAVCQYSCCVCVQSARNDKMRINSQRNLGSAMEQAAVGLPLFMFSCRHICLRAMHKSNNEGDMMMDMDNRLPAYSIVKSFTDVVRLSQMCLEFW